MVWLRVSLPGGHRVGVTGREGCSLPPKPPLEGRAAGQVTTARTLSARVTVRCATLSMGQGPGHDGLTFLGWLHRDAGSFMVCPSVEVRTSVLCSSQGLPDGIWQVTQPNQFKQIIHWLIKL